MAEYKTFGKKQPLPQKGATIWVGNIEAYMDELYLARMFSDFGQVGNVKICRDGINNRKYQFTGFAFVEFQTREAAERLLSACQGRMFVCKEDRKSFRVNWAAVGLDGSKTGVDDHETVSIFVGNLDMTVGDADLFKFFQSKFPSVASAKVVRESQHGVSKGFGFLRVRDQQEAEQILENMQGKYLGSKPISVKHGTSKRDAKQHEHRERNEAPATWPPPPPPAPVWPSAAFGDQCPCQPAITNMTTAQAQLQTWQMLGGVQEMKADVCPAPQSSDPSWIEHFQALLQNPIFVNAFEEELKKSDSPAATSDVVMQSREESGGVRLSSLLHDQPDSWGKLQCCDEMNEDFIMSLEA